jgi:hypothetical protein
MPTRPPAIFSNRILNSAESGPVLKWRGPDPAGRFCFAPQISYCGLMQPIAAAIASASPPVRFRARGAPRPGPDVTAQAARRCEAEAERTARAHDAAARLDRLLEALEAPPVDAAARARLAKLLDRHGAQHVILLVRTIIESEGNANALVEPVISAVSSLMIFCPEWANRGLFWVEAFDHVPLLAWLQTMQDLQLFRPTSIGHYYFLSLRNRLRKVFAPPIEKPPRKASTIKKMRR